ncbi:MAG: LPP20 family lipoprotein [Candidatus Cloacimonetes bacterium]|nr:LPP20 family lipoprotein [Candidatus Cloacimonadota bacterium]MDD2505849.1 LPP20 family lipoprotein [Candidatus Cloacimonadota bacterium]MDD4147995.1 LPP20 family lipoprotein [Candidatus Cloacimonadota bacterium]MDD4559478.1 LPP20 family lipoprotein [Candidatus Cloacimonadota bacterium]
MLNLVLISVLILPALAITNKPPEWIAAPSKYYPQDLYATAYGTGKTAEAAKANALSSLSGFLETRISSGLRVTEEAMEQRDAKKTTNKYSQHVSSDVRTYTVGSLQFAEIKESWYDESAHLWHALAAIERDKVLTHYSSIIDNNEQLIMLKMEARDQLPDTIKNYIQAQYLFQENKTNYFYYNAFTTSVTQNRYPSIREDYILQEIQRAKQQMPLSIIVRNDYDLQIENELKQTLKEHDFSLAPESNYRLIVDIELRESREMNKQHFVNLAATLMLMYKDTELFRVSASANQGDRNESGALKRSSKVLARKLSTEVLHAFGQQ